MINENWLWNSLYLCDQLVCFADFAGMTLFALFFLLPLFNCFLRVCLLTPFAAVLKSFLPPITSAISDRRNSNNQHPRVLQLGQIFTQKENCSSLNNLCKCTETAPLFSTNTSLEWNPFLSGSNHLVTSLRLEMNVGGFSDYQNKMSDTDGYNGYFFTARVSQVNVNAMKKNFEQRSELQVAKCLIVRVMSSSYNVSNFELSNERQATQQGSFRVANDFVLNQVRVYQDTGCIRTMS